MSAINLPVHIKLHAGSCRIYKIIGNDGDIVCQQLSESEAKQIALALNLHDELVDELKSTRDGIINNKRIDDILARAEANSLNP